MVSPHADAGFQFEKGARHDGLGPDRREYPQCHASR